MSKPKKNTFRGRSLHIEGLEQRQMLAVDTGGAGYDSNYFENSVTSSALQLQSQSTLGDLNGDGKVGSADFSIMSNKIGANELQPTDGDFNSDGVINAKDWAVLIANWVEPAAIDVPLEVGGDLNGDGRVDVIDFGIMNEKISARDVQRADGDFNEDGVINAADWGILFDNWTEPDKVAATVEMEVFYWPEYTPKGHSRMLKLNPFLNDNVKIDEVGMWLEDNGWTREGPNAVLITMGSWLEIQATELYKGADGKVTVESIADHVRNGMKNWNRLTEWWAGYLQAISDAGYQVDLVAMDIESGKSTRSMTYSPPEGTEITMLEVINYLYSNEKWARDLPEIDLEAINEQDVYGDPENEQAMLTWNDWAAKRNVEAWTKVFAETAKAVYPDIIVNNFSYSSYADTPLLDLNSGLPRANAAVDANSSPVLFLLDDYGYKTAQEALAAFDAVRGKSEQPHTIMPWIGGPYREGAEGWYVTEENFAELKEGLEQRGVQYLMVF